MPLYKYKAVEEDSGETVEGELEVENKAVLYEQMRSKGSRVISAEEEKVSKLSFNKLSEKFSRVSSREKITFAQNLSAMVKAGLTVSRALSVIDRQTKNPKFKKVLSTVRTKINEGNSLHQAMAEFPKVFSSLFVSMVKAGEESGNLAQSLDVVGEHMKQSYELKRKVKGAMMYPGIILFIMVLIGVLMLVYIVPTLQDTFEDIGAELPPQTKFVIGVSNFLQNYPLLLIGALIALIVIFVYILKTSWGKRGFEFVILHLPVIANLVKEVNAARTTRTMSSLLSSGVTMTESIDITEDVIQNSYYKEIISMAGERIEKGENFSSVLSEHEKLYPVFVSEMISVGEETGKIDEMLIKVAEFYEDDVSEKTKNMSTIIEPVLMVIIGIAVGFFAFSMLTPMYSLVDSL